MALQSVQSGYTRISPNLDDSARMLGVSGVALLHRVHWPLLRRSVFAAALLVFVDVMKELPATLVLRPFNTDTLAVVAYQLIAKGGEAAQAEIDALLAEPRVTVGAALALVLGAALSVPFWHAPALVHWGGQTAGQALFSSALAVWRCKGAFTMYVLGWAGLILMFGLATAMVLGLLGMAQLAGLMGIPAGLVFSAVFYISLLFTFNDSFGNAAPAATPAVEPAATA